MTSKELREKRAKLVADMRAVHEAAEKEKRGLNADEQAKWAAFDTEYKSLTGEIERVERMDAIEAEQRAIPQPGREDTGKAARKDAPTAEERALALQAWASVGTKLAVTDEGRAAAEKCGIPLGTVEIDLPLSGVLGTRAAQSSLIGDLGGYTVPEGFVPRVERALLAFGGVMGVAEVLNTATGEDLPWPTSDDTSNTGEQEGENTATNEQAAAFGQFKLRAYNYSSKLVKVPYALIRDNAVNLVDLLGDMLGERLARILATKFTTGTGVATPQGIVVGSTAGVTSASSTAITADELIDLEFSVDPAYRVGAAWMMNDSVVKAIAKLKDGEGRYMWQPSIVAGQPSTLRGYPVVTNQAMASSIASTAKTILFGQLRAYKVRMVGSIRLKRLVERYAEYDQEAFVAFLSADGGLLDAGTHPVKHLIQV